MNPELLDTLGPDQGRESLRDLVRLNRWWGGRSTLRALLKEAGAGGAFSLLDVGAASGDLARAIRRRYPAARITCVDYIPWHLQPAPHPKLAANAFALPFAGARFDYVFSSLFLHHFTGAQIVALFREFARLARQAVLAIDLERHPVPYYFVPWTRLAFRWNRVTSHDARASVEAAFQPRELEQLAREAGLRDVRARAFRPAFRIALLARPPEQP